MNNEEVKNFNAIIKAYGKIIAGDKVKSKKMLVEIGVITKKGNVRKPYKGLCTTEVQA